MCEKGKTEKEKFMKTSKETRHVPSPFVLRCRLRKLIKVVKVTNNFPFSSMPFTNLQTQSSQRRRFKSREFTSTMTSTIKTCSRQQLLLIYAIRKATRPTTTEARRSESCNIILRHISITQLTPAHHHRSHQKHLSH